MNTIILNKEDVNTFWQLRFNLLNELGEISIDTSLIELENATKKYFLLNIGERLICWGITENGIIVSIASLCLFERIPYQENLDGKEGYILNVYTYPKFRKQGLAGLLLKEIVKYAHNSGIKRLWLNSSKNGKHLYSQYGFINKDNEMEQFI